MKTSIIKKISFYQIVSLFSFLVCACNNSMDSSMEPQELKPCLIKTQRIGVDSSKILIQYYGKSDHLDSNNFPVLFKIQKPHKIKFGQRGYTVEKFKNPIKNGDVIHFKNLDNDTLEIIRTNNFFYNSKDRKQPISSIQAYTENWEFIKLIRSSTNTEYYLKSTSPTGKKLQIMMKTMLSNIVKKIGYCFHYILACILIAILTYISIPLIKSFTKQRKSRQTIRNFNYTLKSDS